MLRLCSKGTFVAVNQLVLLRNESSSFTVGLVLGGLQFLDLEQSIMTQESVFPMPSHV